MGERKGTNKYYPPDYDPKAGGLNKFLGTHALRERARKIHMGIIIIRFEMPYNIWCEGCNNHIGMGVRYNAEKKKVGMYYTTPVYEFKMKCHLCDNHFVIKTDPGNLDYVILSGARRQENRWDPTKNEQVVPETKEVQKRLFDDSMFKLEHGSEDQITAASQKPRLMKLYNRNESTWSDHFTSNQKLRENFRKRSRSLSQAVVDDTQLLKKSSLDIPLLPEREEDKKYASLLSKIPCRSSSENNELRRKIIIATPALPSSNLNFVKEQKAIKVIRSARRDLGVIPKNLNKKHETEIQSSISILESGRKLSKQSSNDINCSKINDASFSSPNSFGDGSIQNIDTDTVLVTQPFGNSCSREINGNIPEITSSGNNFVSNSENEPGVSSDSKMNLVCHLGFDDQRKEVENQNPVKYNVLDKKLSEKTVNSLSLIGDYGSSSDTD